jgi:hypothetical protein
MLKDFIKQKIKNAVGYYDISAGLIELKNRLNQITPRRNEDINHNQAARRFLSNAKEITDRGLFIVGHGRSGTTILLHSLVFTSRDICLLGEGLLFENQENNNYAVTYNDTKWKY